MAVTRLDDMVRGWFIGDFSPVAFRTQSVEVAVQHFSAGSHEAAHFHRQATEVTLLLHGRCRMAGREIQVGEIVTLPPGTISAFEALEDCITVVVKLPGVLDDKFVVAEC
ncbi:hypothetical protein INI85_003654 [Salmonella enterica]|nr:hypothetical protein [Salmonella enterica subsp. enterica serovar Javiana]EEP0859183.1 hypothetical protein [Salmonella enterica]EGH8262064.1 hypothetical protein [Salmonella enterica]EGL2916301.1 hypothetical protein [Salmonella enterica]EJP9495740.1 hypothetical protein [Salmonella enterica]